MKALALALALISSSAFGAQTTSLTLHPESSQKKHYGIFLKNECYELAAVSMAYTYLDGSLQKNEPWLISNEEDSNEPYASTKARVFHLYAEGFNDTDMKWEGDVPMTTGALQKVKMIKFTLPKELGDYVVTFKCD